MPSGVAEMGGAEGGCVVGVAGGGGHSGGDGEGGDEGFGEAAGVDYVCVEGVGAGGHGGQVDEEVRAGLGGVQVEDGVHAGLADGVEVHEVAVVGDEVFVGAGAVVARVVGLLRLDVQVEVVTGEERRHLEGLEDVLVVGGGFYVPPFGSAVDAEGHEGEASGHGEEGAAAAGGIGLLAGLEAGFADGGGDDSGHAEDEEEAEDAEDGAEGVVHPEGGDGDGGDGDGGAAVAGGAGDVEANLPGAGCHEPDGAGVEAGVVG